MTEFKRNYIESFDGLREYCLQQLGDGVIEVNISQEQVNQAINDAIQWFQEFCDEGHEHSYLVHKIVQEDIDKGYFDLPEDVIGVRSVLYQGQFTNTSFLSDNFMINTSILYQYLYAPNANLSDWYFTKMQLSEMKALLEAWNPIRFNYSTGRLYIDDLFARRMNVVDKCIVIDCHIAINPDKNTRLYNNMFLKRYATALVQKIYATNISKYSGIKLPGGTELDGERIYQRAVDEIEKLKEEVNQYSSFPSPMRVSVMG